ncbi:MAG: hypothetical protein H0X67_00970 [Acidobacteria bacterium]|nr:hypothetical protein [Acidobacteriota bacterium]
MGRPRVLQQLGRDAVAAALREAGSVASAARRLGVDRSSLTRWLQAGRVARPAVPSPAVALEPGRVPLSWIADPDAHVIGALSPEQRAVWRACRREMFAAEARTAAFDVRHVLTLRGRTLVAWRSRRRAWLRDEVFNADARVDLVA